MITDWQLAQLNVAAALYPHDDPRMSGFFERLDEVNALAESSRGFVWRLQGETGNATDIQVSDDPLLLVNLSVWLSLETLFEFIYKSAHNKVMAGRRQWFRRPEGVYQVLWWVPAGHQPRAEEGMARLEELRQSGPGQQAFGFKNSFPPPVDSAG